MAQIAVQPFVLKDYVFSVDTDDYEKHISSAKFVPSTSIVTWQGGTSDSAFSAPTSTTWTCVLSYAQDWETADSLSQYLLANAGTTKAVTFRPRGTGSGKPEITADVIITPGDMGGDVDTVPVATVTLGVDGAPAFGSQA